eukprot:c21652_g1_i1.p1 GENE.c21652_g1_i1~~c21652_g1_i1.p1  ORF type:complete len:498 (+),score=169.17 c21652_g1_i1:24-1496(+)
MIFNFLVFLFILRITNCSILRIFENSTSTIPISSIEIQTPGFDLGIRNFQLTKPTILTKGCGGISKIDINEITKLLSSTGESNLIVLIEADTDDNSCLPVNHILKCQEKSWCAGVIVQDPFYSPTGCEMWSVFDKKRDRSEYKVPLAQASLEDFNIISEAFLVSKSKNQSSTITIIDDKNPWLETINSVPFLLYFQILTPIWSVGCIILSIKGLLKKNRQLKTKKARTSIESFKTRCREIFSCSSPGLKTVCLRLHIFTHLSRIAFVGVDPFLSRQLYPHSVYYMGLFCSMAFEIATNILLAFVIRELTQAKSTIDVMKKARLAYLFIFIFIIIDFLISLVGGLKIQVSTGPVWIVKAIFYVLLNIVLGIWYFIQGYKFLQKCQKLEKTLKKEKENRAKEVLVRISTFNSIGLVFFGLCTVLTTERSIFGSPAGNFATFAAIVFIIQTSSFMEILLFAGIPLHWKNIKHSLMGIANFRKDESRTNDTALL